MLRRYSYGFVICCLLGMTGYFATRSNQAADPPADDVNSKPAAPAVPPAPGVEVDPFAVPEGTDEKALHLFITRITQMPPEESTQEGVIRHFDKLDDAISQILSREISDDLYANVAQLRFQIISILDELGSKSAVTREQAYLKQLSESTRPAAKLLLQRAKMQARLEKLDQEDPAAQQALIDEVAESLKTIPLEANNEEMQLALDVAMDIGTVLERAHSTLTIPAYKKFAAVLADRNEEALNRVVQEINRVISRLELPGKEMELQGTTLAGKPFDVKALRGKVVLVDFWGVWCKACVQELPQLQALYEFYHEKGLEVVGIDTEDERDVVTKFVVERRIPWTILFEEPKETGEQNSLAAQYSVNAFPTMMLLDQTGKVVTVQTGGLHGTNAGTSIEKELEKLLGPMPKITAPPAEETIEVTRPGATK